MLLWVWVERRSVGKLMSFLRKGSSKNCITMKIVFSFPTSNFVRKHWTEIFLFFLIMCISIVPNSFKYFAFGTVVHKNVIALADVFPISCQWKDISVWHPYFQYILIHGTHKMPYSSLLLNHQPLHLIPIKVMGLCVIFCAS